MTNGQSSRSPPRPTVPTVKTTTSSPLGVDNHDDHGTIRLHDEPLLPLFSPSRHAPTSPLASSAVAAVAMGRSENDNDNDTIMAMSPPLLKRRAFSHDYEGRRQQLQRDGSAVDCYGEGGATAGVVGDGSPVGTMTEGSISDGVGALRTIPSRSEMVNNDKGEYGNNNDVESMRRRALFSTPIRETPLSFHHPLRSNNTMPNRSRAVSSDVVLDISSDCLPRYDDDLAATIAGIANNNIAEESNNPPVLRHERASLLFSTPQRPITRPSRSRDRANTCPHRPQRHSIFQDEEFGIMRQQLDVDGHSESFDTEDASSENNKLSGRTHHSLDESNTNVSALHHSPERRRYSSSSVLRTPQTPPILGTPSSSGRRAVSSAQRPQLTPSLSTQSETPPNSTTPHSPQTNNGRASSSTRTSPVRVAIATTQQQRPQNCILRINPTIMKFLMVLSLYVLLAYTWNTDLQFRSKSVEINYGLSEYWQGGIGSPDRVGHAVDKLGRNIPGKLFNDDGDDEGIAKLINGLNGEDAMDASGSASGDTLSYDAEEDAAASSLRSGIMSAADRKKRIPSLSHARSSLSDVSHPAYGVYNRQRAAVLKRNNSNKRWTLSRMAWCLVWAAFMLPIVEAALREVRRQLNVRFWNVRRLRSFRAMPNNAGRVSNVHDL